jgi:hypothetical protein
VTLTQRGTLGLVSSGWRTWTGLVLPTLLAALTGALGLLAVAVSAGAALQPATVPPPPVIADVRPPEPLDAAPLGAIP